jgi:hypothetical protein
MSSGVSVKGGTKIKKLPYPGEYYKLSDGTEIG